ncbi:hypothetical protein ACFYO5_37410 [Streptomyces sp. NPDC006259]|uniref:hypothetical protein n=1 Tax=Streptomyces sp. NPDC006259 TaxID=3364740 RepID=UPI0036C41E53
MDLGLPDVTVVAPPEHNLVRAGTDLRQAQVGVQVRVPLSGDGRVVIDGPVGPVMRFDDDHQLEAGRV